MNKKVTTAIIGSFAVTFTGASASNDLVQYSTGKVSQTRNILIAKSDADMRCGKDMKKKIEECKKLMEEASCGTKMKECKNIMEKIKESKCGSMMKSKEKVKEMACGSCGAMK